MILKTIEGKEIFETRAFTVKEAVEEAASLSIDLRGVDLRRRCLKGLKLNNCDLSQACLWGCDLSAAILTNVNFSHADGRLAQLTGARLIDCDLSYVDFSGARFNGAALYRVNFMAAQFSDLHLLNADILTPLLLASAVFKYKGEWEMPLQVAVFARGNKVRPRFKEISHNKTAIKNKVESIR